LSIESIEAKSKRVRGGDLNLDDREGLKKLKNGKEKLELILALKSQVPENSSQMTEAARNFVNQSINPILNCLENHFQNNKGEFIAKWQNFSHALFKKKCCKGVKQQCGV